MGALGEQVASAWWEEAEDWRDLAACRGEPVDLFFPTKGLGYRRAKRLCDRCTVAGECRRFADEIEERLGETEVHGFFGGESPNERIRRRKGETAEVTASP